jgi:hypothetical protein
MENVSNIDSTYCETKKGVFQKCLSHPQSYYRVQKFQAQAQ